MIQKCHAEPESVKANVFQGPNKIGIEEVPRPSSGVGEAVIRITLTTKGLHRITGQISPENNHDEKRE